MSEQNLTFEVNVEEANLIAAALGELPAKASMGLIQKLQGQASPQLQQQNEAVSKPEVLTEG